MSTPIGHLEDLSHRAERILREVDLIVCEDTRVTRKLLSAYNIQTSMKAYHAHSSESTTYHLVELLTSGQNLALVSDAGTPLLSDPGRPLIDEAIEQGLTVIPVPGASAVLSALVGSGIPSQPFVFIGFLPRSFHAQREIIGPVASLVLTLIFYESPHRVSNTLLNLGRICGPSRKACVARELTKQYETFERGSLSELAERFESGTKGEVVIVVGPASGQAVKIQEVSLHQEAQRLIAMGMKPSEAAKTLAGVHGLPKKQAYALILKLSEKS
ncbi:MAG: 16S rRNA (cytidine(1402)-2'-O)-methyltransferase [Myxococcales bacterium]|nr:16S rRNA (cytidine(1402)-2'-O)-methyltransferase [Myxococcales bacterium]